MSRYFNDELYHSSEHTEEEITHYGVLGMKWGIRRYQPYSYTGGSGKEVGEAKKLAKLSGKSEKLKKKIDKMEKKRTNRFAIATNSRYRGRIGDKQQKLIKKKAKIDRKIKSMPIIKNDKKVASAARQYMDLQNKANDLYDKVYWSKEADKSMIDKRDMAMNKADQAALKYQQAVDRAINKYKKK